MKSAGVLTQKSSDSNFESTDSDFENHRFLFSVDFINQLEMLTDWEQTTHFQQFNLQKIPVL